MKTKYFIFAASALVALASCSNEEYIGDNNSLTAEQDGSIQFGSEMPNATRATYKYSSAATRLHNEFVVWGEKNGVAETKAAGTPVFTNYVVQYTAGTAHKTESNSSNWEYVDKTPYAGTIVSPAVTSQTIKYWDFNVNKYTFTAFSALPADLAAGNVTVTKNTSSETNPYDKGYTVNLASGGNIDAIYFADRTPVEAGPATKSVPVTLNFRHLVSQVRFGFYETVPGYSVKITNVKFNSASHTADGANNFGVDCSGAVIVPGTNTAYTVTYYDNVISAKENKAKVAVVASPAPSTQDYLWTTAGTFFDRTLGTASNSPLYNNSGNYTTILPNPSNTSDLTLTISYKLISVDGSGEEINITDAKVNVPAVYAQWQSNYAYTYLFKISESIEKLYPITFDACVVEDQIGVQQTITVVSEGSKASVTTYSQGAITNEYTHGNPIYAVVTYDSDNGDPNSGVIDPSAIGVEATQAQVYKLNKAATEAEVFAKLTGSTSTLTLTQTTGGEVATLETTVPLADGTTPAVSNVKFTPSAAGYYAYVYTKTKYVAPVYAGQGEGTYDSEATYYALNADTGAYYVVTVSDADDFATKKSDLYIRTSAGTEGEYYLKVIKVQ